MCNIPCLFYLWNTFWHSDYKLAGNYITTADRSIQ